MEISGYALDPLTEDDDLALYRGRRPGDSTSILVLTPTNESPKPAILNRLDREYSLASELHPEWAVRPLALERREGRTVLLLEDPGGEPLRRALGQPLELGRFLRLAVNLATALGRAHRHGLIHKDLKPENLLVDAADRIRLMGFGIASRLPRERQAFAPPEVIEGALPYMAPEQTGRMNRSIDIRSDLYSLGVTLYEMLSAALPFAAADASEWVHCHIARPPIPLSERLSDVPPTVDAIILKLLAKSPEARYQTTSGVVADLRRCLAGWEARGRIDFFPIGTEDASEQLMVPEGLYGRAREVDALLAAFERVVSRGTSELVLVSGQSGIGKSAAVKELHKALAPRPVFFGSGKHDQDKRGMPYATLVQAFQDLLRQIFGKGQIEVQQWGSALQEAVGANGQLIVNLIPELELIIGKQPPVAEIPPHDGETRFQMTLQRLLAAFARPEHPLVLVLDDLQWLDEATLNLLRLWFTGSDVKYVLLCGAYRSDEIGPLHPLTRTLAAIRDAGTHVQEIMLAALTLDSIEQLVADALRTERERVQAFAGFVHQRTGGNPLFAVQLITALSETGRLVFNDEEFDERTFEQHLDSDPGLAVAACSYWIRKLQARVLANDQGGAVAAATKAERLLWASSPASPEATLPLRLAHGLELAEYHFWAALAHAGVAQDATVPARRSDGLDQLRAHHKALVAWTDNSPRTFADRAALVAAELARLEGRELDAERHYEQAIRSAREQGFVDNEALAHELAARFHRARGLGTIADAYLRNARACYRRWGAFGKLKQLDALHPHAGEEQASPLHGGLAPLAELDIGTVLRASQAMSGEIVIDRLIEILMTIALEHAGASRGTLVLRREDVLRIEAEAEAGPRSVAVRLVQRTVTPQDVPDGLLRTAMRTRRNVIVDDAQRANPFAQDRYFQRRQPRSVLCLPLVTQAQMLGILYLENDLAPGTFTAQRTALLEVLAAQAAISLDVARLYRDVEQREARIRRLVDANIVGIFIWEFGGGIREANDAFLRMIGWEREDLVAGRLHWTRLTPPEWRDRSAQAIEELKMTGIMQPYEKEYIRKDRSRVPVMIGSASFEDGSKQGVSFVLDLTERKRAEGLNAQVFESAPDGICIVGRDYRYRRANPVYARRWGTPAERIVGMHVAEVLGADVFERILKPRLDRCFAREEVAFEWVAEARGGLFIAVSYSPLRSGSSDVEAALVIQRDITEYMRASESLREAQAELAHVNRVTTMGELGASIAHEVNQPITGVLTSAQTARHLLARGEAGQEGARRAIERIIRDAARAGDVIGRIRDLVKKAPPRRDRFDLNGAIRDVIELSRGGGEESRGRVGPPRTGLAPRRRRQGPAAAGDPEPHRQCRRSHERYQRGPAGIAHYVGQRQGEYDSGYGPGLGAGAGPRKSQSCLSSVLYDEADRSRHGSIHMPFDHRGAQRTAMGKRERAARRRLPFHPSWPGHEVSKLSQANPGLEIDRHSASDAGWLDASQPAGGAQWQAHVGLPRSFAPGCPLRPSAARMRNASHRMSATSP